MEHENLEPMYPQTHTFGSSQKQAILETAAKYYLRGRVREKKADKGLNDKGKPAICH
jgi:hypothetical protein